MALTRPNIQQFIGKGEAGGDLRYNGQEIVVVKNSSITLGLESGEYDPVTGLLTLTLTNGSTVAVSGFFRSEDMADGPQGNTGQHGDAGQKGINGSGGRQGQGGPQGPSGRPGRNGEQGQKGLLGSIGTRGHVGQTGLSGYDGVIRFITGGQEDPGPVGEGVLWLLERIQPGEERGTVSVGGNLTDLPSVVIVEEDAADTGGGTGDTGDTDTGGMADTGDTTGTTGTANSTTVSVVTSNAVSTVILYPYTQAEDVKFGTNVGLSNDGQSLVITAPYMNNGGFIDLGEAYLYKLGTTWAYHHSFTPQPADQTDSLVYANHKGERTVSSTGQMMVVGVPYYKTGGISVGKVEVYRIESGAGAPTLLQTIGCPVDNTFFGTQICLSGDQSTLVCASSDGSSVEDPFVFKYDTDTDQFVYLTQLYTDNAVGHQYFSVNHDGSMIATVKNHVTPDTMRRLRVFAQDSAANVYNVEQDLPIHNTATDTVGHSMTFNKAGDVLFLGTTFSPTSNHTAVYVYKRINSIYQLYKRIKHAVVNSDGTGYQRINNVTCDDSGDRVVITHTETVTDISNVYVFDMDETFYTYVPTLNILPNDPEQQMYYNNAISTLSGDGHTLVVGAPDKLGLSNGTYYKSGAVFIHTLT